VATSRDAGRGMRLSYGEMGLRNSE
jgi:hypothetical protein